MNSKQVSKPINFFSAGCGIFVLAVGIVWLGKSLGIIAADFDILKYIFPVSLILFGIWMIAGHFIRKTLKQSSNSID